MDIFMSSSTGNLSKTMGFIICFKGTSHKDKNSRKGDDGHKMWEVRRQQDSCNQL